LVRAALRAQRSDLETTPVFAGKLHQYAGFSGGSSRCGVRHWRPPPVPLNRSASAGRTLCVLSVGSGKARARLRCRRRV